jgi:hypothetical protein
MELCILIGLIAISVYVRGYSRMHIIYFCTHPQFLTRNWMSFYKCSKTSLRHSSLQVEDRCLREDQMTMGCYRSHYSTGVIGIVNLHISPSPSTHSLLHCTSTVKCQGDSNKHMTMNSCTMRHVNTLPVTSTL